MSVPVMWHPTNVLHISAAYVFMHYAQGRLDLLTHRNRETCAKIGMAVVVDLWRGGMQLKKRNEDITELDTHRPTVN